VVPLLCVCDGFVDDEMWLQDSTTPVCKNDGYGSCWVEAGYIAGENGWEFSPGYFWAEARPVSVSFFGFTFSGGAFFVNFLDAVPDQDFGGNTQFLIIRNFAGSYVVIIDSASVLYVENSPISMVARQIIIGQELAGSGGLAAAPTATFTRNIWVFQSLSSDSIVWYIPQTQVEPVTSQNPPYAQWDIAPGAPGAPQGGKFSTRCR
jgi:hypothetical protein